MLHAYRFLHSVVRNSRTVPDRYHEVTLRRENFRSAFVKHSVGVNNARQTTAQTRTKLRNSWCFGCCVDFRAQNNLLHLHFRDFHIAQWAFDCCYGIVDMKVCSSKFHCNKKKIDIRFCEKPLRLYLENILNFYYIHWSCAFSLSRQKMYVNALKILARYLILFKKILIYPFKQNIIILDFSKSR